MSHIDAALLIQEKWRELKDHIQPIDDFEAKLTEVLDSDSGPAEELLLELQIAVNALGRADEIAAEIDDGFGRAATEAKIGRSHKPRTPEGEGELTL